MNFVPIVQGFAEVVKNRDKLRDAGETRPEAILERVEPIRDEVNRFPSHALFQDLESTGK